MAQNETWLTHDLLDAVKVQYLDGNLFSMDNAGNLIGVILTRGGENYSGGGSVSANVIRSDGGTVAVSGALSGKTATVVLPQTAYAVPGVVSIIVKLTANGQVTTIAALVANVYRSSTDTAIDPGTIIPSIQTLISQINSAVASIPADYSALWTKLAPAFSENASYVAGQYVTRNSGLYRFNTTHTGNWSDSDVTAVNLGGEITDLKSAVKYENLNSYPVDINTILSRGIYTLNGQQTGRYTNLPSEWTNGMAGYIVVDRGEPSAYVVQTAYYGLTSAGTPTYISVRRYLSGTFTPWTLSGISDEIIPTGTDLNSIEKIGFFTLNDNTESYNAYTNAPPYTRVSWMIVDKPTNNLTRQVLFSTTSCCYFRIKTSTTTWTRWIPIGGGVSLTLNRGKDLNQITQDGFYSLQMQKLNDNPFLHGPDDYVTGVLASLIVNNPSETTNYPQQIIIYSTGQYYYRKSLDGGSTWGAWSNNYETRIKALENGKDTDGRLYSYRKNLLGIFHTIGVVGDSLASGQGRVNDYDHLHDFYEYSWPQCMGKILQNTVYNFTKSGLTTRSWLTDSMGYPLMSDGNHKAQCYIIGLGVNDMAIGSSYLGSQSDIKEDYTQNADTYYGNYARIISLIKAIEPRAVIFTIENPCLGNGTLRASFNEAVAYMSTIFDNVYDIVPDATFFSNANGFIEKNKVAGHYTPAAYMYIAEYLIGKMSEVIYNNPEDFYFANLIGTNYDTPTVS